MSRPTGMPYLGIYICTSIVALLYAFVYTNNFFSQAPTLSAVCLLRMAVALGTPEKPAYGGHGTEETECSIQTSWSLH